MGVNLPQNIFLLQSAWSAETNISPFCYGKQRPQGATSTQQNSNRREQWATNFGNRIGDETKNSDISGEPGRRRKNKKPENLYDFRAFLAPEQGLEPRTL